MEGGHIGLIRYPSACAVRRACPAVSPVPAVPRLGRSGGSSCARPDHAPSRRGGPLPQRKWSPACHLKARPSQRVSTATGAATPVSARSSPPLVQGREPPANLRELPGHWRASARTLNDGPAALLTLTRQAVRHRLNGRPRGGDGTQFGDRAARSGGRCPDFSWSSAAARSAALIPAWRRNEPLDRFRFRRMRPEAGRCRGRSEKGIVDHRHSYVPGASTSTIGRRRSSSFRGAGNWTASRAGPVLQARRARATRRDPQG